MDDSYSTKENRDSISGRKQVAIDPVCHMQVDPQTAAGKLVHAGTSYCFCNMRCLERFKESPERFANSGSVASQGSTLASREYEASTPGKKLYICPMDPDVRSDKMEPCPICGMDLEPEHIVAMPDQDYALELADMSRRFWIALAFTVPVVAMSAGEMIPGIWMKTPVQPGCVCWVQLLLSTPVVAWCGLPFFQRAWRSLAARAMNMFTLVATGIGVSFLYSVAATVASAFTAAPVHAITHQTPGHSGIYFETAAMITTLVLLGQVLELRMRRQTNRAIALLLGLAPRSARKVAADGQENDILLTAVCSGDILRIRPGERIPADGKVVDGTSSVDEALMTGEPTPVSKQPEDALLRGTINGSGSLLMRADRVGQETVLAQIVRLVEEAQRSKAPIQRLADRVAAVFVPVVIAVAAVTFAAWIWFAPAPSLPLALSNAIAVLIVACPCALGLATPLAIKMAAGRGAASGILIKDAITLEMLEQIDTLVIDKTGTLTEGTPSVVSVLSLPGRNEAEVLRLAASLEKASEHPLASATITGARLHNIALDPVSKFQSHAGKGVTGSIDKQVVAVGNEQLFRDLGISLEPLQEAYDQASDAGQTIMFVASDGKAVGAIIVADALRETSIAALKILQEKNISIVMATGDSNATARHVADQLGIKCLEAELTPAEKAATIERLKAQQHIVAMAGDGVNDAVALSAAHVGIAMGSGADVAMASAGITLSSSDLTGLVRALELSRQTMTIIRQNLFFAFFYNTVGILVATGALYPFTGVLLNPMIASCAMTLSSLSVIANSMRLRSARI